MKLLFQGICSLGPQLKSPFAPIVPKSLFAVASSSPICFGFNCTVMVVKNMGVGLTQLALLTLPLTQS